MCSLEKRGRVYILTLLGDGDHRFNPSTMDAISAALQEVQDSQDAGTLVTTNQGRYFSNGLDLQWISQNPDVPSSTLRIKFETLLASFMRLRVPTIAAICGHAAAGGFMLALAHDYRFMRGDRSVLYMSELDIGLKFSKGFMAVIRSKLMPGTLRDVVLGARKFSAQMALEGGIVDSVYADSPQTLEAAIKEAQKLAGRGWKKEIYSELRLGAFPGVLEELDAHEDPYNFPLSSKL